MYLPPEQTARSEWSLMMKKDLLKGIGIGVGMCALTLSIGVTALAAGRTIAIDDGIRVTVNGTALVTKDAKGNAVPVFTYEGTTYVPARALAEALGFQLDYNSATRVVSVTGRGAADLVSSPTVPANENYIGEAKARDAALKHAGQTADGVTFVKTRLDRDNGTVVYEVEFYAGNQEYDYEIDALTGAVVEYDNDAEYVAPGQAAYIGEAKAKAIAQAKAPGAAVTKCELDLDDGRAKYELELRSGATEYDCEVDAVTGTILTWEIDR